MYIFWPLALSVSELSDSELSVTGRAFTASARGRTGSWTLGVEQRSSEERRTLGVPRPYSEQHGAGQRRHLRPGKCAPADASRASSHSTHILARACSCARSGPRRATFYDAIVIQLTDIRTPIRCDMKTC